MINPPSSFHAEKSGLAILADVAKMGLVFQHTGAVTTKKFIREHTDTCAATCALTSKRCTECGPTKKPRSKPWRDSWAAVSTARLSKGRCDNVMTEALYPKKQYPSVEGLKTVIDDIAERDPRAKSVKPEQFIDASFIRELDQSGFIDGLYKK